MDDVEVRPAQAESNYAGNPGFENGMTSLSFVGNHSRSSLETNSGYPAGGVALHVRTADSILTGPNGVQITLTNTTSGIRPDRDLAIQSPLAARMSGAIAALLGMLSRSHRPPAGSVESRNTRPAQQPGLDQRRAGHLSGHPRHRLFLRPISPSS